MRYVIHINGGSYAAGLNAFGVMRLTKSKTEAMPFDSAEQASAWWSEKAPTLPAIGEGSVRLDPLEVASDPDVTTPDPIPPLHVPDDAEIPPVTVSVGLKART